MQKVTRFILFLAASIASTSTFNNVTSEDNPSGKNPSGSSFNNYVITEDAPTPSTSNISDSIHYKTPSASSYDNITGGNQLWNGLLRDCQEPTMSCVQKNVYHYLDDTFKFNGDVNVGDFIHFKRNNGDYNKYTREANNYDNDDEERSNSPLEEVTEALQGKSVAFMMTHDVEVKLPDTFFEGATFKVSPRSLEGDGVLVKLDLVPREEENKEVGRILLKKIKKFFKGKLVSALMAIILVVGLLKTKLMFLMPIIVGVGTAKKILLKVLLFLFPALSHLFKLCSYYHDSYHGTKYHHHHHQISHIHHAPPPSHHPHLPEIHADHPDIKHEHHGFEFSGPGFGHEYLSTHRKDYEHTPSGKDDKIIKSWGLGNGQTQGQKGSGTIRRGHQPTNKISAQTTKSQVQELTQQAEKEVMLKLRLQQEQLRIRQENIRLQEQLKHELKLQEQLKIQAMLITQQKTKLQPQQLQQVQQLHQAHLHQAQIQQAQAHAQQMQQTQSRQSQASKAIYDPFYSPILEKIDKLFTNIGVGDEPCRERLICSMYKNPVKFSPHSNLLSAELSRDSKELQKPTTSNEAVVRFYRYVQAARDGQDQRECLRLYPSCAINTEA